MEQCQQYHKFLSVSLKGSMIIHKRDFEDVYTNNYNTEMLKAWIANMDIQLALDTYAVIIYIIGYVNKDESGMTKELTEVLKAAKSMPFNEQLKLLATTFINHRQIGGPEAIYRLLPFMKLCKSNIGVKFVSSGFPENRSIFFVPVKENSEEAISEDPKDDDEEENIDEYEINDLDDYEATDGEVFEIEGKPGKYRAGVTIFDQYSSRPSYLKELTLAQFAITYKVNKRQKKNTVWELDEDEESCISQERTNFTIFNSDKEIYLPERIKLRKNLGQMSCRKKVCVLRYHLSKKKEGYEQFYSEMLLFTPWVNEVLELFPYDEAKCVQLYEAKKDMISYVKSQIFPGESAIDLDLCEFLEKERPTHVYDNLDCEGELENDDLNNLEQTEDNLEIAPLHWTGPDEKDSIEPDSKREGGKYKIIPLLKDDDLMKMTRGLVAEQKQVLSKVIAICKGYLKARSNIALQTKQLLLLIHGGAGVGKSKLIEVMSCWIEKTLCKAGNHPGKPRVLIMAATGKAASIVNGVTIHQAFDFKWTNTQKYDPLSDKKLAELRFYLSELKVIIIDEISLVGSDMVYRIHMRLCEIFHSKAPFANKSVIAVGDVCQLRPVKGTFPFEAPFNPHFSAYHSVSPLWKMFEPFELVHNHRQGDGFVWAQALNRFRVGMITEADVDLLKERITPIEDVAEDTFHIMYTNAEVAAHNQKALARIEAEEVELRATKGKYCYIDKDKGTIDSTNMVDRLYLKIGARVKLVININTMDGLVNGAFGTVLAFERNLQGEIFAVIVQFDQQSVGTEHRMSKRHLSEKYKANNGTPIFKHTLEYFKSSKSGHQSAARAKVIQFPLWLAHCSNSHQTQGLTVKSGSKVAIHWNTNFQKGMAYVMLSRAERLEDIQIIESKSKFTSECIKANEDALRESNRIHDDFEALKQERMLFMMRHTTIAYLNVRRLLPHLIDVKTDPILMESDIITLGETWLKPSDTVTISGYDAIEVKTEERGKGLSTFVKSRNLFTFQKFLNQKFSAILIQTHSMDLLFLYL